LLRNCYENFQPLMSKFNLVGKQEVDEQQTWNRNPTVLDHVLMLYTKYQKAVISSCQENCYENFLPLTINIENLT
jgi:predicted lipoprotein with Yx(FWY)xxD motif